MDVQAFVAKISNYLIPAPNPPGNAQPSVAVVNPLNPSTNYVVGPNPSDLSWSTWLDAAQNILTAPVRATEGAWTSFSHAGQAASSMVKTAIDTSVNAVTGTIGVMKWLVVGLVAFAIIYALFLLGPAIGGITAPLSARSK